MDFKVYKSSIEMNFMDEEKMKWIYILSLFVVIIFIMFLLSFNPHKSVTCKQQNSTIVCENLAIVDRECIIYYGNYSKPFYIKGLSKVLVNTTEKLLEWICQ